MPLATALHTGRAGQRRPAGLAWPNSVSQFGSGKGALSQLGPRSVLPVTASFLTKQPLSTPPKMHCPCPQRRQMLASLHQQFQPCLLRALGRGVLSLGWQRRTASLSLISPTENALLPQCWPRSAGRIRHLLGEGHSCTVPRGYLPGQGAWEGPSTRGSRTRKNNMFFLLCLCCPCSQDSTLLLIFSLILVQELGEAGEDS